YMDEESHRVLNQPWHGAWDRSLHARLIDNLNRWHARAIVFDVLFLATNVPSADAELVRATKESGKVVLASIMAPDVNQGSIEGWKLTKAFTPPKDVAASGVVEEGGKNKVIRRHFRNTFYPEPSMAWQAAKLAMNTPQGSGASGLASHPMDPFRERWVNYYGPPGFIPHLS